MMNAEIRKIAEIQNWNIIMVFLRVFPLFERPKLPFNTFTGLKFERYIPGKMPAMKTSNPIMPNAQNHLLYGSRISNSVFIRLLNKGRRISTSAKEITMANRHCRVTSKINCSTIFVLLVPSVFRTATS